MKFLHSLVLVTYVPVQINICILIMKYLVRHIVHYIGSPNLFQKFTVHLRLALLCIPDYTTCYCSKIQESSHEEKPNKVFGTRPRSRHPGWGLGTKLM